jgi:hypothetical protein
MIQFLQVGRTPRSFAASMAGFRQGLVSAAPGGAKRRGERRDAKFLGARGMCMWGPRRASDGVQSRGRKFVARRCSKGARGAAVRCQPKPLTRTWMSAVPNSQTPRRFGKDRVARSMSGDWLGLNAITRLLKQDVHTADTAMDEMPRRTGCCWAQPI